LVDVSYGKFDILLFFFAIKRLGLHGSNSESHLSSPLIIVLKKIKAFNVIYFDDSSKTLAIDVSL